jgi:hypothetical protein
MRFFEITDPGSLTTTQHYLRSVRACVPYVEQQDWANPKLKFHAHQAYSYWFNVPEEDKRTPDFKEAESYLRDIISKIDLPRHNAKRREKIAKGEIVAGADEKALAEMASMGATSVGSIATTPAGGEPKRKAGSLFGGKKSLQKRAK